jgi:hypothetical protein
MALVTAAASDSSSTKETKRVAPLAARFIVTEDNAEAGSQIATCASPCSRDDQRSAVFALTTSSSDFNRSSARTGRPMPVNVRSRALIEQRRCGNSRP